MAGRRFGPLLMHAPLPEVVPVKKADVRPLGRPFPPIAIPTVGCRRGRRSTRRPWHQSGSEAQTRSRGGYADRNAAPREAIINDAKGLMMDAIRRILGWIDLEDDLVARVGDREGHGDRGGCAPPRGPPEMTRIVADAGWAIAIVVHIDRDGT